MRLVDLAHQHAFAGVGLAAPVLSSTKSGAGTSRGANSTTSRRGADRKQHPCARDAAVLVSDQMGGVRVGHQIKPWWGRAAG